MPLKFKKVPWKRKEVIGDAVLYLGDCLEILPTLPKVDAVITDPKYGIGFKYENDTDTLEDWCVLMNAAVPLCKAIAPFVIMPSCAIKRIEWWYANHKPEWLVAWHKGSPGHMATIGFNDWEPHVCWGRPTHPMHDHFSTPCGFEENGHPCPKPISYSIWLVERGAVVGQTVCDPFMGSGTTGVACMNLGRKFIGIEIEPKYFDIACERIRKAAEAPPDFFLQQKPKPIKLSFWKK